MKASERLQQIKRKRHFDVGKAFQVATTAVKFRNQFEGQLPKEFDILPNPEDIYADEKAHQESEHAQCCVHKLLRDAMISASNSGNDLQSTSKAVCKCVNAERQLKHSVKAAPGMLSNNWKKSNLMKFVNKEH